MSHGIERRAAGTSIRKQKTARRGASSVYAVDQTFRFSGTEFLDGRPRDMTVSSILFVRYRNRSCQEIFADGIQSIVSQKLVA